MVGNDVFRRVVEGRHTYAQEWKGRTGRKVFGYLCTYVPEELIYAAGILPIRILGSHEPQDVTEPHIFNMYCPFCRDCLAQGLMGRYSYLDGLVTAKTCPHIAQTFDSWQRHVPVPYSYYLYVPSNVQNPHAQPCLEAELADFKRSLEAWSGKAITSAALGRATDIYNTNRRLMKQIYELRQADNPPISGAESMEMVLASQCMDKAEHNQLLQKALEGALQRHDGSRPAVRLMVLGSESDDLELLRLIEASGAGIVIDDHCTGSRYFWNEVAPGAEQLKAISARYINRPPCPQKDWLEGRRFKHLSTLAKEYNIQGAIVLLQKFCDPHQFDMPPLLAMFKENNIPTLTLECDVSIPVGQFQTRIQAFLEMLQVGTL